MRTAMEDTLAGTGVELLLETEGTEILMNEDGSVKGVKAVRGADTLLIYADSVVIDRRLCVQPGADRAS